MCTPLIQVRLPHSLRVTARHGKNMWSPYPNLQEILFKLDSMQKEAQALVGSRIVELRLMIYLLKRHLLATNLLI